MKKKYAIAFRQNIVSLYPICLVGLLLICASNMLRAQCGSGQAYVQIQVLEDINADWETNWVLKDQNGQVLSSGTPEGANLCVPANLCLTFTLTDSGGNGLSDGSTNGYAIVRYNGTVMGQVIGNFGSFYSLAFGNCVAGYACNIPITATYDNTYTAPGPNTWYAFTPDTTGLFVISTCNNNNICNTLLWVYDYCTNLQWDDTQQAAIAYNDDYCGQQAQISIAMQKNETYYIRVGDVGTSCQNTPIEWQLSFAGPITGCMDIYACNYDPLATVSPPGACIYAPSPACPDGPDLAVLEYELQNSMYLDFIDVNSSCTVNEGCSTGYNNREIIRFSTHIQNVGNQDYYIGPPNSTSGQFEWDNCHNHWHYEGYAEYLLYDQNGTEIPIGFKNGFCVLDLECYNGGIAKYSCGNMGISAGCGDIYDSYLSCQWVDITNVAAGIYTLVVRVNWDQSPDALGHYETNYANNWAQACIQINRNGSYTTLDVFSLGCNPYVDCLGQIYGNAQPDCNGNCNGGVLAGDLDQNGLYSTPDLNAYLNGIAQSNLNADNCKDLNDDDTLTVTDVVRLQACIFQQNGTLNQGSNDYCQLPTPPITNPNDTIWFSLGNYDAANQTIDLLLKNPTVFLHSFQFRFSGAQLAAVVSLMPLAQYDANVHFNYLDGKAVVFSNSGNSYAKYTAPMPILRLYLSNVTNTSAFCVENFTAVNNNFEEVVPVEMPACLQPYLTAQLQVILQGAYNASTGYMRTVLRNENLLPAAQPFNRLPWNYAGNEYIATGDMPSNMVDWLLLELQNADNGQLVSRRAVLLLDNGVVRDINGNVGVNFPGAQLGINYKIVVRSRQHLPVISANAVQLPLLTTYSFAVAANIEGGTSQVRNVATSGLPLYALIAGDFNANGVITIADYNKFTTQLNSSQTINMYNDADATFDGNVLVNDFNAYYANFSVIGVPAVRY